MRRRTFIHQSLAATTAIYFLNSDLPLSSSPISLVEFTLPKLSYGYDALEPYLDSKTMEIHHSKHHGGYVANLNKELVNLKTTATPAIEGLLKSVSKYSPAVRNNAGGHYNHSLFWTLLSASPTKPSEKLLASINQNFQSFENFTSKFSELAKSRFGSGWVWLTSANGKLSISSTPNQDNPLMDVVEEKGFPIIGLDVWEHAYYLKYQNNRAEYINSFWKVLNWEEVNKRFASI